MLRFLPDNYKNPMKEIGFDVVPSRNKKKAANLKLKRDSTFLFLDSGKREIVI